MTEKQFYLQPEQIERLVADTRGCLSTDRIVVDGERVGFLYREEPTQEADSGWRFMVGDETPEYMAQASNVGVYALNTLCNYERSIIELLESPPGTAFAREEGDDEFIAVAAPGGATPSESPAPVSDEARAAHLAAYPDLHPDYPVVEGDYQLTAHWAVTLPEPCSRRFEDGSMVLWRPGLTIHIFAWDNITNTSVLDRLDQLEESIPSDAFDHERSEASDFARGTYRQNEDGQQSLNAFVIAEPAQLVASMYFDDEAAHEQAVAIAESLRLELVDPPA